MLEFFTDKISWEGSNWPISNIKTKINLEKYIKKWLKTLSDPFKTISGDKHLFTMMV
jgi:hypothetical protein